MERPPKDTDQANVRIAFLRLAQFLRENKDIELAIWVSAIRNIEADIYKGNNYSYEIYKSEMTRSMEQCKAIWEVEAIDP
jgi:hypothetical protein